MSFFLITLKAFMLVVVSIMAFFALAAGLGADLLAPQSLTDCEFSRAQNCIFLIV